MWALMWRLAFGTGMRQGEPPHPPSWSLATVYRAGTVIPSWLHVVRVRGEVWMVPPKSRKGIRLIPLEEDL